MEEGWEEVLERGGRGEGVVRGGSGDGPGMSPKWSVQPTCSKRVRKKNWVGDGWLRGELGEGRAHSLASINSINNGCNLPTGFCSSQHLLGTSPCQAQCPGGQVHPTVWPSQSSPLGVNFGACPGICAPAPLL